MLKNIITNKGIKMLEDIVTSRNEGQLARERVYREMAMITDEKWKEMESRFVANAEARAKAQFEIDIKKSFWVCVDVRIIGQFTSEQEIKDFYAVESNRKDSDLFCEQFKLLPRSKDAAVLATPIMFFGENPTKNMLVCAKTPEEMQEG